MALIKANFFSQVLLRNVEVMACIPMANSDEMLITEKKSYEKNYRFPVLYLLHGAYGDYTDWFRNTKIEKYAERNGIAVVTVSINNSFAVNLKEGEAFEKYIYEEVVDFSRYMFPVSDKREETVIGGVSMGGYAAFRLAFLHNDVFGCACSLSGGLDIFEIRENKSLMKFDPFLWEQIIHGDPDNYDLVKLGRKCAETGKVPRIYAAVGFDDFVCPMNREMEKKLNEAGIKYELILTKGDHNWDYWDSAIEPAIVWAFGNVPETQKAS